jgi:hypothetical protein
MKSQTNQKLAAITANTLIVGVDIAKSLHWARFIDCRGIEIGNAISFRNDKSGYERIVSQIERIRKQAPLAEPMKVIVGYCRLL